MVNMKFDQIRNLVLELLSRYNMTLEDFIDELDIEMQYHRCLECGDELDQLCAFCRKNVTQY